MFPDVSIRQATPDDLDAIAALTGALNARADQRCLMCPETAEDVRRDMAEYGDRPADHFVLAFRGDRLVGAVSCDWDEEQGRGWLLGPFVVPEAWEEAAPRLLEALLDRIPEAIQRLDTYTDEPNTRALQLYLDHGFREFRRAQVYTARAEDYQTGESGLPAELPASEENRFLALHAGSFPEAPDPGPEILDRRDPDHPVFAAVQDGVLVGYLAAKINDAPREGYVDYLAVDEAARGRGTGTRLLRGALFWFFVTRNLPQASLIVHESNRSARGIYEKAGFRLTYTGIATRRFS